MTDPGRVPDATFTGEAASRTRSLVLHDLRSAVADITDGLSLVDLGALGPDVRAQLEGVRISARTAQSLIQALAPSETADADDPENAGALLNLHRFLHDLELRWSARARAKNMGYRQSVASDVPAMVSLERQALDRILSNLLDNATKFATKGAVLLSIDMRPGGELRLSVSDSGPGFSDESLARLFQFGGRPRGAQVPGTGLGLHIAKTMADNLGGQLQVYNRAVGGAIVSLLLPHSVWEPRNDTDAPPPEDVRLDGARVLLAEDSPTSQLVVGQMLDALGATVEIVDNGAAALECLRSKHFDLALLDIELPVLTGLEVIQAVGRTGGAPARVPLVALTAYVMPDDRRRIFGAGAAGLIAKPVNDTGQFGRVLRGFLASAEPAATRAAYAPVPPYRHDMLNDLMRAVGQAQQDELLVRLHGDLSSIRQDLDVAARAGDATTFHHRCHALISLAESLGARDLGALAKQGQTAADARDADAMAQVGPALDLGLVSLLDALPRTVGTAPA